jgi:sialate O-acetylesterase
LSEPVRIACCGASVVFGRGLANRRDECYPAVLQRLLDRSQGSGACSVRNFGYCGATASESANEPYARTPSFAAATRFRPNHVLLTLGTNDAQGANAAALEGLADGLRRLVLHFRAIAAEVGTDPARAVIVTQPAPAFPPVPEIDFAALEREVRPVVRRVAEELGAPYLDFCTPLAGRESEFPDGLHPTAAVAAEIARIAHDCVVLLLLNGG